MLPRLGQSPWAIHYIEERIAVSQIDPGPHRLGFPAQARLTPLPDMRLPHRRRQEVGDQSAERFPFLFLQALEVGHDGIIDVDCGPYDDVMMCLAE